MIRFSDAEPSGARRKGEPLRDLRFPFWEGWPRQAVGDPL